MKIVYLCHPVKGETPADTDANINRAMRWVRWIYDWYPDVFVMSQWIVDCLVLDDANPVHRNAGMMRNIFIIPACDEGWLVGGETSKGMKDERTVLFASGKGVRDMTHLGPEPPSGFVELPGLQVKAPQGVAGWNLPTTEK